MFRPGRHGRPRRQTASASSPPRRPRRRLALGPPARLHALRLPLDLGNSPLRLPFNLGHPAHLPTRRHHAASDPPLHRLEFAAVSGLTTRSRPTNLALAPAPASADAHADALAPDKSPVSPPTLSRRWRAHAYAPAPDNPRILWPLYGLARATSPSSSLAPLILPVSGIYILLCSPQSLRARLTGSALAARIFLALFTPGTLRNQCVSTPSSPARTNLGVEFCPQLPWPRRSLQPRRHPALTPSSATGWANR